MKKLLSLAALVVLVGCVPPKMTPDQKAEACGYSPSQEQAEAAVRSWVQQGGLKDPFSAQTQNISVDGMGAIKNGIINGGEWRYGWIVSFQVNAKNGFGAYVGWRNRQVLWNKGQVWWLISPTGDDPPSPSRL